MQNKICYLKPTLLDFKILARKRLPFETIVSLAVFDISSQKEAILAKEERKGNNLGLYTLAPDTRTYFCSVGKWFFGKNKQMTA